jgi:hypothetical protein
MDGPSSQKQTIQENMTALSLKDLLILKLFIEKGRRAKLFLATEELSVTVVHTKLTNLINNVIKMQQAKQAAMAATGTSS